MPAKLPGASPERLEGWPRALRNTENAHVTTNSKLVSLLVVAAGFVAGAAYAANGITGFCHDEAGHLTRVLDVSSDVSNCGACGATCSTNHVAAACASGTCNGTCAAGWADCNSNKQSDGCETSIYSVANCGACGVACSTNNVAAACASGTCTGTCAAEWGDCNGDMQSDGCETALNTAANCGRCGRSCTVVQKCVSGACVSKCSGLRCPAGSTCDPDSGRCYRYIP